MSKATSSTRSVMITRSLCPRSFWTCCANCTRMLPSSPKLEPLGREHSNCTSWAQRTVAPQLRPLWKFSFWTFCTANGKLYASIIVFHKACKINGLLLTLWLIRKQILSDRGSRVAQKQVAIYARVSTLDKGQDPET